MIIQACFFSTFKLERIRLLSENLENFSVTLDVPDIGHRDVLTIYRVLLKNSKKLILTHDWLSIPVLLASLNLFNKIQYILILNGVLWDAWIDKNWSISRIYLYRKFLTFALSRSQFIICNSQYLLDRLDREFPQFGKKAIVIRNGTSFDITNDIDYFPFDKDKKNFLTVTNFEYPRKYQGLNLLFEAMQQFDNENSHLHVLGKALSEQAKSNAKEFVQNTTKAYPKVNNSIYINAQVHRFFQPENAIFVYSSGPGGDSLPRAILEAQSAGMPGVIVDTNGCAEAVIPGHSALVVPPDSQSLQKAMMEITSREFNRSAMSHQAIENISTRFSWERMADEYSKLLYACSNNG